MTILETKNKYQQPQHFETFGSNERVDMACPSKIGPLEMRDSCKITTGGSKSENKKVFEGAGIRILKEVETGMPVVNAAREYGVSPATIHRWKSKYDGMTLSELKRLKALEEENARLKRIVAQQALDNELLREINAKKW